MEGKTQETAAAQAGMSVRSARKWQSGAVPSETRQERIWRTRPDPFDGVWEEEIEPLLQGEAAGQHFFTQLAGRQPEVKQRCRTVLQTRAEGLLGKAHADPCRPTNVDPTLVSV